jgi:thioredoxin 2
MPQASPAKKVTVACPFCGKLNRVAVARAADRPICGECGKPLLMDRPLAANDANLDKIVSGADVPVLVDFYADWCGPCKVMAPVLDEIARTYMGRVLVLKLDTDRNPQASARYGIRGIPTLILFRSGREAGRQVGAVPRQAVVSMFEGE